MSGMRQKIQYSLALAPEGRGEAPGRGHQGTEPPVAKPAPESPACAEQLMEEVCDRGNLLSRPSRNQTRISNALRPRPYGLSWMICRFTSARIFPQRGCKLNEPNGFEPLRRVHDHIIRVLWPINFAHKRQRVRS